MKYSTKYLSRIIILLMLSLLGVSSCGDKDDEPLPGDWPPMAWRNIDFLVSDGEDYLINENGGTFTFECTNYTSPWLGSVRVNDEYQIITDEDRKNFKGEWFEIKINGNKLQIRLDPLPSSVESRAFYVWVSVGDTGTSFTFHQERMSST